jgi:hypothetical protein
VKNKEMLDYCNALKETARQKESDNTEALSKQQLLSRIRKLEAENYILKQRLSEDDWK